MFEFSVVFHEYIQVAVVSFERIYNSIMATGLNLLGTSGNVPPRNYYGIFRPSKGPEMHLLNNNNLFLNFSRFSLHKLFAER